MSFVGGDFLEVGIFWKLYFDVLDGIRVSFSSLMRRWCYGGRRMYDVELVLLVGSVRLVL